MVRVWGTAAGKGSTKEAARGAFTWREYPTRDAARAAAGDWLAIAAIEKG